MSRYRVTNALIQGIISADTSTKQELGRRFAYSLGLTPGPLGADGGIDGKGFVDNAKVYFQSKLENKNLGATEADKFYAMMNRDNKADIGIMLAGVGYTSPTKSHPTAGFRNRLLGYPDIDRFVIHLLTLRDIFEETAEFEAATQNLPTLRALSREAWKFL
ncbi:hypothetical protein PN462_01050 [Spirulina sp. CS-785/01]|uniref:hypothetical protein n=1 Tax=Spirulina sp. CS-785/01 TaxID=3021716 RepID=UPI00232E6EC2|nr:hypothetical protein [Spirulina sp. CS-785/01]MDB9311670.1 hypothetical protein [Spirulina sp. CS-785/01]